MLSKGELKVLARLTALETLVEHLLFMIASSKSDPIAELRAYRERVLADSSQSTLAGVDPAMSDLLMQELTEALDAVLSRTISRAQESQRPRRSDRAP